MFFFYINIIYITYFYTPRYLAFSLSWFFLFYWLQSIFIFLWKKNQKALFTRMLQRFWKRTFMLFWLIELFLFLIYLFLAFISPQEPYFMMDISSFYINIFSNFKFFFINYLNVLLLIFFLNIWLLINKYNIKIIFLHNIILILYLLIFENDIIEFLTINQYYNNLKWIYNVESSIWELENTVLKSRTFTHYFYILIFFKIWHTLFIFGTFLISLKLSNYEDKVSYNLIAIQIQNSFFFILFFLILKILILKNLLSHLYEYIYYWFFVNYHFYDFNNFFQIISCKDFFFFLELF